MATETANTTATRAVVFHPSSSVGFPHPRQRDGGGRNDVGVADLVDGRNDGRRRRECLVFMSQLPNGGGDAQARRPERRDFKRQSFDQPRIARIGAERSAHHAHLSHDIAERCRAVIDARHNPHNPHDLFHQLGASRGGRDHCQSCLGNFRNGSNPEVSVEEKSFLVCSKTKHRQPSRRWLSGS